MTAQTFSDGGLSPATLPPQQALGLYPISLGVDEALTIQFAFE